MQYFGRGYRRFPLYTIKNYLKDEEVGVVVTEADGEQKFALSIGLR